MGYTTEFEGHFTVTPPLKKEHAEYLRQFSETRRMRRNSAIAASLPDPVRDAVRLPIGDEGGFFVGGDGYCGQAGGPSITDYNSPPRGQPGLWCKWVPNRLGTAIKWSGAEKFYDYTEWLKYLIANFLKPWGYTIDGKVKWQGEEADDFGVLVAESNVVLECHGVRRYRKAVPA